MGDAANSIIATADNCYLIGGNSVSGISGDKTESCRGGSDFWLVKLLPDELSADDFKEPLATIFPNPTEKNITITFETPQSVKLTMVDITGKLLQTQTLSNSLNVTMELNYRPGFYLLVVETIDGKKQTFKIYKR